MPRPAVLIAALLLCACSTTAPPSPIQPTLNRPTEQAPRATAAVTPAATVAQTPRPTAQPLSASPSPSVTLPVPSSTVPPAPRQLTEGGCCAQPFWSADGSQVRYIDRPSSGQPSGIWAVSANGGAPTFVTARLGLYSPDEKLVAYPEGGQTFIERVGGARWK